MVGGWWVVDTIPFQIIYFSTITLGDDLLVLLFPATDTEFAISGIIFRMATKSIANTQLVKYLHLFQLPKSILSGNWLSEGREEEKSSSMMMISESGGVSDLSAPLYLETWTDVQMGAVFE